MLIYIYIYMCVHICWVKTNVDICWVFQHSVSYYFLNVNCFSFFCPLLLDDSDWVTILLDFWGSIRYENGLPPISPDQYEWLIIISRHDFKYVKLYNDVKCFFGGLYHPNFRQTQFSAAILNLTNYPSHFQRRF